MLLPSYLGQAKLFSLKSITIIDTRILVRRKLRRESGVSPLLTRMFFQSQDQESMLLIQLMEFSTHHGNGLTSQRLLQISFKDIDIQIHTYGKKVKLLNQYGWQKISHTREMVSVIRHGNGSIRRRLLLSLNIIIRKKRKLLMNIPT
jgi:hypothetical protein